MKVTGTLAERKNGEVGYCCLGVLGRMAGCSIDSMANHNVSGLLSFVDKEDIVVRDVAVAKWAGLRIESQRKLAHLNDTSDHDDYRDVIKYISKNL